MDTILSFLAENDAVTTFYADKLRASLFTGFLSLSGFLFTIKTFLVIRLQQDVYGDKEYQDWVLDVANIYNKSVTVYGSLRQLGKWLFWCVCAAFFASAIQLTIGLVPQRWAAWTAIVAAFVAGGMFVRTLFIVRVAIRRWVDYLEEKLKKRREAEAAEKAAAAT